MLYDVLPPLTLFLSFGGIIVLVSRVALRMRNEEVTAQIHAEISSNAPVHEESLLGPGNKGVQLVKNRVVHGIKSLRTNVGQSVDAAREAIHVARQKASGLHIPEISFRERLNQFAQKGKDTLRQAYVSLPVRAETPKTSAAPTPVIRLVRHAGIETAKQPEKSSLMSKIVKREKEETPLEKAANEIASEHFDAAEDILVPYIMKHASDAKAYVLLGNAAIGRQSWEEAMEIFQQVIKIDSTVCDAYAQLGHAALNAGKFTQAIEALQHARNMDEKNIQVREELLFIAHRMDNKVVEKSVQEELAELKKEIV